MLPQEFALIGAEEIAENAQDVQSYFEHRLWADFCCETLIEDLYMNIIEKNPICGECYRRKLTFFESEVTLSLKINHIVMKDFYDTLKFSNFNISICETITFCIRERADKCSTCAESLIELYKQEAILNDVDSKATTTIYNNE